MTGSEHHDHDEPHAPDRAELVRRGEGPPPQQEVSLEDLIRAAGPIATAYFENQERMQQRELEYDTKVLEQTGRENRNLLIAAVSLTVAILSLATILILNGREQPAFSLIQLVAAVGGAAFGGFGVAKARERRRESEE